MTIKNRISDLDPSSPPPPNGGAATSNAATRRNIIQAFWRHRWWIVVCTALGVVGGYVYMKKQVRIFNAFSRIYIQENKPNMLGAGGNVEPETGIATQIEVIRCTPLLETVAARPEVKELGFVKTSPSAVNAIKAGIGVFPGSAPDLLTITFEAQNPVEAAIVVNAIVDCYVDFTTKQKKNSAVEALRILTREKEKVEGELQDSVKKETEFQSKHGSLSFTDEKGNIILQRLARVSDMATSAQLETIDAKTNYDTIMALKGQPKRLLEMARNDMPQAAQEASINADTRTVQDREEDDRLERNSDALRADLNQAERALAKLKLSHTSEHYNVKEAEEELTLIRKQLAGNEARIAQAKQARIKEQRQDAELAQKMQASRQQGRQQEAEQALVDAYLAKISRRYAIAQQREASLNQILAEQQTLALGLNEQAAQMGSLAGERKRLQDLSDLLANRIQAVNVNEDTRGQVNVSILDVGKPNFSPVRPDKPRILGMGLILGIAIGCALAFGLDLMDERFHSADEVVAALDLPLLGIIPHIVDKEQRKFRGRHVALEPTSDVAESYRTIRTAIYFAVRNQGAKRLLVTSPAPGDGKTTTTTNIAIAMAQAGRRILLIDADFRKPTVHKIFQMTAEVGVTSIMLGEVSRERAIQSSGIDNLDILPCGPLPSNPAEILNGQAFLDLLEGLDRMYDHIIIDSPPVVPVTDARILGALCDDVLIVLRAEKSTRRISEHACESLLSVGARILGVVVNDVPRRRDGYGYYYGYGYGYRYYQYGYGYKATGKDPVPPNGSGNGKGHGADGVSSPLSS